MFNSWERKLRNLRVHLLGYVPNFLLKPVAESSDVFNKIAPYNFYILLNIQDTALPAAMRYILKAESYDRRGERRKTVLDNSRKCCKSISRPLLIKGSYEQSVSELFVKYLKSDSCVVDIGANIGYYSLLAASQCPQGKVFSFEPDNKNFQLLKTSIVYNGFEKIIQAYNFAVSDANKTIIISDLGNPGNSGARFTAEDEDLLKSLISAPDAYFKKIEAIQLDTFLTESRVDIVKIDIEGHEPYAIRGMLNILKRYQPIIFAELAPSNIKLLGGMEAADFLQLLLNIGYRISLITKSGSLLEFSQDIPAVMSYFEQQQTHHVDLLLTV